MIWREQALRKEPEPRLPAGPHSDEPSAPPSHFSIETISAIVFAILLVLTAVAAVSILVMLLRH